MPLSFAEVREARMRVQAMVDDYAFSFRCERENRTNDGAISLDDDIERVYLHAKSGRSLSQRDPRILLRDRRIGSAT